MTFADSQRRRLAAETRVVKLGGSLLASKAFERRLRQWLDVQTPCATILVVGGGELADAVRQLDHRYGLPAQVAHDQAIRAMQVNAFVLSRICPELSWGAKFDDWKREHSIPGTDRSLRRAILDPVPFMQHDEPTLAGDRLPCGWQVTSDSIAARLAQLIGAAELVLLKSTLPPHESGHTTFRHAAAANYVDQYFPRAADHLPRVRAVNLRDGGFPETRLTQ